jgi:hypothetical protein
MRLPCDGGDRSRPAGTAAVFDNALPPDLLAHCTAASDAWAACAPNFWVPRDCAAVASTDDTQFRTLAEQVVASLHARCLTHLLPAGSWSGAEWWCQVYNSPGRGLPFHWDKDEAGLSRDGVTSMRHPLFSCVLYLNTADECSRQPLGATAVLEQRWCNATAAAVPPTCRQSVFVWPRHNRLLVFDGDLSHGVLDADAAGATRRTLLVNWWAGDPPAGVIRLDAEEYAQKYRLPRPVDCSSDMDLPQPAAVPMPHLTLSGSDMEEPLSLVDALHAAQPSSDKPGGFSPALGVAALSHPGCLVWQLEGEGGEEEPLMPALVPDSLLPASDTETESSSDDEEEEGEGEPALSMDPLSVR